MNTETISFKQYLKNLSGVCLIGLGAFLLIEHIWTWSELAFYDFIGHEWLGFIFIMFGMLLNMNWSKERLSEELK